MSSVQLKHQEVEGVSLICISGYYNDEAGSQMDTLFQQLLKAQKKHFVLDFSGCETANSPGVASLMDLCLRVTDDYRGRIVIFGVDPLKDSFFTMVGIFNVAQKAGDLPEALRLVKG